MSMSASFLRRCLPALIIPAVAGCGNAGADLGFGVPNGTTVTAIVFYDRDGSVTLNAADTLYAGVKLLLLVAGTRDTVATGTSDAGGVVNFPVQPVGQYSIEVDTTSLGDSLVTTSLQPDRVTVTATGSPPFLGAAVGFALKTVAQARALPVGSPVMLTAVMLAGSHTFSDGFAFVHDTSGAIRLIDGTIPFGPPISLPGDSVKVAGRVGLRDGEPVIDSARVYPFIFGPAPVPDTVTTAVAATAAGGASDADLLHINGAVILDTTYAGASLHVQVDDGSGVLDLFIDANVPYTPAQFAPGRTVDATGVAVATGTGAWQLRPRSSFDYTTF
jgi:hypothetical protein